MQIDPLSDNPKIALVAGEASGDQLGAALIEALRIRFPNAFFFGVGGERMRAAGFDAWWDRRELSVMGLFEVIKHLPRLLDLRKSLRKRILESKPDVLIGIDAPDFNLGLEKSVRESGIPTVHYVSPTVWAWRTGRAAKIGQSADLVLCLFPFEPRFYEGHGVAARYTGHPMADRIPLKTDKVVARARLGIPGDGLCVALLPGSRMSEVERLTAPMLDAAGLLAKQYGGIRFVAALADETTASSFESKLEARDGFECSTHIGVPLDVMEAADVVICASGTAALECMLVNRPMVVVYRLAAATFFTARALKLVKSSHIALPNILAGENLVPELIQHDVNGPSIADAVSHWLDNPEASARLQKRFDILHRELKCDAAMSAALAIEQYLDER